MTLNVRNWRLLCLVSVTVLFLATTLVAAERRGRPTKIGQYDPTAETVEMFAAIEKGDIAVKLIPKDSTQSQVLIENKTDRPLNVKLPEAFAGVPVLAQGGFGGQGAGGGGSGHSHNNSNNNSGNQGMGGGMGGMMGGGGMGAFNVPPEKVGKFKVPTVCLDHGKAEPRAAIPYTIKPIESYSSKPGVRELCEMLGTGKLSQRAAQVAAWHLNNDMSWQELAAKRVHRLNGPSQPYFTPAEIQAGMQIANSAVHAAKEKEKEKKPAPSTTTPSSISSKGK